MSTAAEDERRRANRWRSVVAVTLRALGVTDAEARPAARRRPEEAFTRLPDVSAPGLGIHVKASVIPWSRVSTYLFRAAHEADELGFGNVPILVRPAPGEDPRDAYVVLRLSDMARLALDAAKGRSGAGKG